MSLTCMATHHTKRHVTYLYGHLTSSGDSSPTCMAISPHLETSHLPVWPSYLTWRHLTYLYSHSPHLETSHLPVLSLTTPGDILPTWMSCDNSIRTNVCQQKAICTLMPKTNKHLPVGMSPLSHLTWRHLPLLYGHLTSPRGHL